MSSISLILLLEFAISMETIKKCPMHACCEDVKQLFHILENAKNLATTIYQKMIDLTFRDPHSHLVEHLCFTVIK